MRRRVAYGHGDASGDVATILHGVRREGEQARRLDELHEHLTVLLHDDLRVDLCMFAKVPPILNQVETHVFWQQAEAHANMETLGVQHMAWGPFAEGANDFFHNPLLAEIGAAHGKSVGQVALRYLIDSGVVVIPKSTKSERMAENINVFGFELTAEDKARIAELDTHKSICFDHTDLTTIGGLLGFIKTQL